MHTSDVIRRIAPQLSVTAVPADSLSATFQAWMLDTATAILEHVPAQELPRLEEDLVAASNAIAGDGLALRAAVKLAASRAAVQQLAVPARLSIVAPMYAENTRLTPRGTAAGQHEHGEDALRIKVKQLDWITAGTPHTYTLFMVDDMSKPEEGVTSGEAAQAIVDAEGVDDRVRVLFLEDGVRTRTESHQLVQAALRDVAIPKNTKKAAAIYYGMAFAVAEHGIEAHYVGYIDTDLTVNAALFGLLLQALQTETAMVAAGSRRLPTSVLKLGAGRNLRANLARYFRTFLLGDLLPKDTQCGIKLLKARTVEAILGADEPMHHLDFTFDVELLGRIAQHFGPNAVVPVPIAAFDSAAMTTTDASVHHALHRTALQLAEQFGRTALVPAEVQALAIRLAESEPDWQRLLEVLPQHPDLVTGIETFDPAVATPVSKLLD